MLLKSALKVSETVSWNLGCNAGHHNLTFLNTTERHISTLIIRLYVRI